MDRGRMTHFRHFLDKFLQKLIDLAPRPLRNLLQKIAQILVRIFLNPGRGIIKRSALKPRQG